MKTDKFLIPFAVALYSLCTLTFNACTAGSSGTNTGTEIETGTTGGENSSDDADIKTDMDIEMEEGNPDNEIDKGTESTPEILGTDSSGSLK